ncbi:MAG: T9SS type A sorting domain-containing protein [Bacteroidia bacterium]|nr:T9SS type A sorting domain-containing protein [Bacteroidia bacterium]
MSLGETIGHCAKTTQNNSSTYTANYAARYVHIALMGDPSLREHIIAPPSNLSGVNTNVNYVELHWTPSPDSILGYYVFKLDAATGVYNRISPSIVNDTNFYEANISAALNYYMVRAIRLEESMTGTYYNMSEGIFDTVAVIINKVQSVNRENNIQVYPNPANHFCLIDSDSPIENISVYDGLSRLVISMKNIQTRKCRLDLSELKTGIYVLEVDGIFKKMSLVK